MQRSCGLCFLCLADCQISILFFIAEKYNYCGPSRAGKTTIATKINEELNYFTISPDKLVATFQGAFPQLDIRLNWN